MRARSVALGVTLLSLRRGIDGSGASVSRPLAATDRGFPSDSIRSPSPRGPAAVACPKSWMRTVIAHSKTAARSLEMPAAVDPDGLPGREPGFQQEQHGR